MGWNLYSEMYKRIPFLILAHMAWKEAEYLFYDAEFLVNSWMTYFKLSPGVYVG